MQLPKSESKRDARTYGAKDENASRIRKTLSDAICKKTDQCIDDENEPGTCAFSDKSWQAHQGPSEQLGTFEQLGKSKQKLLPAETRGQAP